MALEVTPSLPPDEERALAEALGRAGVDLNGRPAVYGSAWRQAGLAEATGNGDETYGYALLPRSTRGATRA